MWKINECLFDSVKRLDILIPMQRQRHSERSFSDLSVCAPKLVSWRSCLDFLSALTWSYGGEISFYKQPRRILLAIQNVRFTSIYSHISLYHCLTLLVNMVSFPLWVDFLVSSFSPQLIANVMHVFHWIRRQAHSGTGRIFTTRIAHRAIGWCTV